MDLSLKSFNKWAWKPDTLPAYQNRLLFFIVYLYFPRGQANLLFQIVTMPYCTTSYQSRLLPIVLRDLLIQYDPKFTQKI